MEKYIREIKEEVYNNSILLSYALSIVIIGIFSFFYKENDTLIVGVAISTIILIIIQIFYEKNNVLSVIPIIIMLLLGFFQEPINKLIGLNIELKENIKYLIIFISFSLSFIALVIRNIKYKYYINVKEYELEEAKRKIEDSKLQILNQLNSQVDDIQDYMDGKSQDKKLNKKIRELKEYLIEEETVSNVKSSLIVKGEREDKREFTINEIEKTLIQCYGSKRYRNINAVTKKKSSKRNFVVIEE